MRIACNWLKGKKRFIKLLEQLIKRKFPRMMASNLMYIGYYAIPVGKKQGLLSKETEAYLCQKQ